MGNKIRIMALLMVCIMCAALAGCNRERAAAPEQELLKSTFNLYFVEENGNKIASEQKEIQYREEKELPQLVMEALLQGPSTATFKRVVPKETLLLGCSFTGNDTVVVNLSGEYANVQDVDEIMARYTIVQTMCELPNVQSVILLVEGKNLIGTDGKQVGALSKDNIVLDRASVEKNYETVTLYFSDYQAEYLVPEVRTVVVNESESMEKNIVSELLKGPTDTQQAVRTIPQSAKLLSVDVKDGTCFVNFSQDFISKHSGGSAGEMMTVYSVVNTLTELPNVDKVEFLIEGQRVDVFISMIFNEPFTRDESLIRK